MIAIVVPYVIHLRSVHQLRNHCNLESEFDSHNCSLVSSMSKLLHLSEGSYSSHLCFAYTVRELRSDRTCAFFMLQIIKDVGSWTLKTGESDTWDPNAWDLQTAIMAANGYGVDAFFGYGVGTDDKNSSMQLIMVSLEIDLFGIKFCYH